MNAMIEQINPMGKTFVEFLAAMLIQSSILIGILLLVDFLLRNRVRAIFRYCIWMLVLIKLVLPSSISSPFSVGYLFGNKLASVNISEPANDTVPANLPPTIYNEPIEATSEASIAILPMQESEPAMQEAVGPVEVMATPLTWQGAVLLVWAVVAAAMGLLLIQRAMLVCGLVRQAKEANNLMNDALEFCRKQMGIKQKIGLKVSANATSPAVCGLIRPVILLPQNLGPSLGARDLRAVLMHELAHIKRGDLWVNLAQTILQIIYFYNPLLWLANAIIRRVREQAVDEAVQVAMGQAAQRYPETLVNVAKMAFKQPALGLRLIGVVESKSALKGRIKRMLDRPIPKSAKLGVLGLFVVIITGAVLLPMAKAEKTGGQVINKQSRGEEILKRMAEVNRYWLTGPPSEVKSYSYEFALYQEEFKTFKVTNPLAAQNAIRQGITYDSVIHQLMREPSAATYTTIEEDNGTIKLDFMLKEPTQISVGNGLKRSWYGYFNRRVEGGTFWIDAKKMVPVRAKCNDVYEYFSDYTAVDNKHYVPLRVKVDVYDTHFDWNFKLHKPGLWLFDVSHYEHDGNKEVVAASISNVQINEDLSAGMDSGQGETAVKADSGRPVVVKTTPKIFANDVSSDLNKLTVTFDQPMMDKAWSWVQWDAPYPKTVGSPYYDDEKRTCTLPVKLEPGKAYLVAFNIEPYTGFVNISGEPAKPYVLVFSTKGKDDKPTPIPEELITKAKSTNERAEMPYTQEMFNDIQPDGMILFKSTIREINRSGEEINNISFINSDFVHVTGMSDDKGRPLQFTSTHEGDIYSYKVTFNEPVLANEVMKYTSEGTIEGLVNPVPGSKDAFQYSMTHWPQAGQPTRRIETYLLPAGAELIFTTPEDMQRQIKDGRIELHVEKMIPTDGGITTAFRYRLTGVERICGIVTVKQRSTQVIAGSGGQLAINIGDITAGQVQFSLIEKRETAQKPLIPTQSIKTGDVLTFEYDNHRYKIKVIRLINYIAGEDEAIFEISSEEPAVEIEG